MSIKDKFSLIKDIFDLLERIMSDNDTYIEISKVRTELGTAVNMLTGVADAPSRKRWQANIDTLTDHYSNLLSLLEQKERMRLSGSSAWLSKLLTALLVSSISVLGFGVGSYYLISGIMKFKLN